MGLFIGPELDREFAGAAIDCWGETGLMPHKYKMLPHCLSYVELRADGPVIGALKARHNE
jgi:hypothetical protein